PPSTWRTAGWRGWGCGWTRWPCSWRGTGGAVGGNSHQVAVGEEPGAVHRHPLAGGQARQHLHLIALAAPHRHPLARDPGEGPTLFHQEHIAVAVADHDGAGRD